MKQIRVSIVIATYRSEKSLVKALESLANQTYDNYEIVLVDDNGDKKFNKKVNDIVIAINKKYNINIKLIVNKQNQGSAKSRNIGIENAEGKYITFLDDDDEYLPNKIDRQLKNIIENKADYSITDLMLYNDNNKLIDKRTRKYIIKTDTKSLLTYHLKYHMTGTDTLMFTKEYLQEIGAFDLIDVGDEFYLMLKAIKGKGKISYLNECSVKAYIHMGEKGLSSGQSKINGENQLYEFKKKYFADIDDNAKRFIRMRHYAVLAFTYLKLKKYKKFIKESVKSFCCYPTECIKLIINRL